MLRLTPLLFVFLLAGCTTGYQNDGKTVTYHRWNEGSGHTFDTFDADAKTFSVLSFEEYGKDNQNAFYKGILIPGADAQTFEAIDDYFARDKNTGYHGNDSVENSRGTTFRLIKEGYTTDGLDVFYYHSPLHVTDVQKFHFVDCEAFGGCWTSDGKYY